MAHADSSMVDPVPRSSSGDANLVASFLCGNTPHTSVSTPESSRATSTYGSSLNSTPHGSATSLPSCAEPISGLGAISPSESSVRSGTTYQGASVQANPPSSIASSNRSISIPGTASTPPSSIHHDSMRRESLTRNLSARPSSHRSFSRGSYQGQPGHPPPNAWLSGSDTPRSVHDTYSQGTSIMATRNSMTATIPSVRSFGNLSSSSAGADETMDELEPAAHDFLRPDARNTGGNGHGSGAGAGARPRPRPASTTGATAGSASSSETRTTDRLLPSSGSARGGSAIRSGRDRTRGGRVTSQLRKALIKPDCCTIS